MPRRSTAPMIVKPVPSAPMIVKPVPSAMTFKRSIFASLKDGFGFGVGSAVARHAVDSIFSVSPPEPKKHSNFEYEQCLAENADFIDSASICAHHIIQAKESK